MRADVFTDKDRKIIKIILEYPAECMIYKYYCKGYILWHMKGSASQLGQGDSFVKNTLTKLEKLGIIVSDMSEQEYRIQYALGTTKYWVFYIPENVRKILEKLYEDVT